MSTDRTCEQVWADILAGHAARGTQPPTEIDAETETILREILGDDAVNDIKAQEALTNAASPS